MPDGWEGNCRPGGK